MTTARASSSASLIMQAQKLKSVDWLQSALVHGVLLLGLFIGVQWKSKPPEAVPVQVEIFSAPAAVVTPPPPPTPPPTPLQVRPAPSPVKPTPLPLPESKVDIAIEKKAKAKLEEKEKLENQKQAELKKAQAEEKQKEEKQKEEKQKVEKLKAEKVAKEKLQEKLLEKAALEKANLEKTAQSNAEEKSREDALRKIIASAGSTAGNTTDKNAEKSGVGGNALSASDITRLQNMIRSNTVFQIPESMKGNPEAEFIVSLLPDCTVAGVKLKKSSGLSNWDDAAERAIARIKQFPRPASGTCASSYSVTHKPLS
jgi:colicin import membrane protein